MSMVEIWGTKVGGVQRRDLLVGWGKDERGEGYAGIGEKGNYGEVVSKLFRF